MMSKLFARKKEEATTEAPFHEVDNTRTLVNDFKLRIPWDSYRSVDYHVYEKLRGDTMTPMLDACMERLFAGADDGNGDMLDQTIFSAVREAQTDLARQRVDHRDMIRRLALRRKADREDFVRVREEVKRRLDKLEREFETLSLQASQHE